MYSNKSLWLAALISFFLAGCSFHLQTKTMVPDKFKIMTFYSAEPYGFLAREIKQLLISNQITLIQEDEQHPVPALRILSYELNKDTASIYQDGKAAEYQLILAVNAEILVAKQDSYPITIKVFRSFFDNPSTALAKNTEQTLIKQEMYKQAADQIVRKIKTLNMIEQRIHD